MFYDFIICVLIYIIFILSVGFLATFFENDDDDDIDYQFNIYLSDYDSDLEFNDHSDVSDQEYDSDTEYYSDSDSDSEYESDFESETDESSIHYNTEDEYENEV